MCQASNRELWVPKIIFAELSLHLARVKPAESNYLYDLKLLTFQTISLNVGCLNRVHRYFSAGNFSLHLITEYKMELRPTLLKHRQQVTCEVLSIIGSDRNVRYIVECCCTALQHPFAPGCTIVPESYLVQIWLMNELFRQDVLCANWCYSFKTNTDLRQVMAC